MKKFKKALALSMTLAMGLSMVACGGDSKDTSTSTDTSAPATEATTGTATEATTGADTGATEAPSGDVITSIDGKVTLDMTGWDASKKIYGYSWDDDFGKKLDVVFENQPALKDYFEYINLGVASEESLTAIDAAFTSDKYPSLIPSDVGSSKYWINDDTKTLDLKSIGFTDDMLADSYQFAKDFSDYNGQLKAVTWQTTAGSVFYNRKIANEVFGTDDPAQIQEKIKDWDSFFAAAEELKAKGYKIVSSPQEVYYAITNTRTDSWVSADGSTFTPDATITQYIEVAKKLADGDYTNMVNMWDGSWFSNMAGEGGNVFCYFACPWMIGQFTGNGAGDGTWGTVVGPTSYYWGGTYVCVGKDTPNPELCKFILYELTCDADIMVQITNKTGDAVNNKAANAKLAADGVPADNAGFKLFNQNPYETWAAAAEGINTKAVSAYDKPYEAIIKAAADGYITGTYSSVDEALDYIKNESAALGIPAAE